MTKTDRAVKALREAVPNGTAPMTALATSAIAQICRETDAHAAPEAASVLGDPVTASMAYALCEHDEDLAHDMVEEMMEAGLSVEEICLSHLAPAARRLGALWDTNRLSFTDVTLASSRIQSILRRLPPSRSLSHRHSDKGALFSAVPGEEHTLGVMMAADLFRRHGWDVGLLLGQSHEELIARIARDDRPVVGLSCSGSHSRDALIKLVRAIVQKRPDVEILLSGQIVKTPEAFEEIAHSVTLVDGIDEAETEIARIEARHFSGARGSSAA